MRSPGPHQIFILQNNITVAVTTVVLHERSAADLLANPITACFAAGARRGKLTTPELCAKVAAALRSRNATWAERHMAVGNRSRLGDRTDGSPSGPGAGVAGCALCSRT